MAFSCLTWVRTGTREMGPIGALASGQMDQVKAIKAALGR